MTVKSLGRRIRCYYSRMADLVSSALSAERIQFGWLVRLRWVSLAGQALIVAVSAEILGFDMPLAALAVVMGVEALVNVGAGAWLRRAPEVRAIHVAGAIAADLLLFAALL